MSKIPFLPYHPLTACSIQFQKAAALPRHMGVLTPSEGIRYVEGGVQSEEDNLMLTLLVDEEDGVIADAKYRAFAHPAFIAIVEITCVNLIRKSYEQARRITSDYIMKLIENTGTDLPAHFYKYVNLTLDAIFAAVTQCMDIPLQEEITSSPLDFSTLAETELPEYEKLTHQERLDLIKHILDHDVRPYIELDAGGIEIVELKNEIELIISYQGACVSCPSAIGGTLDAITQILRAKVHPHLIVQPDLSSLNPSIT